MEQKSFKRCNILALFWLNKELDWKKQGLFDFNNISKFLALIWLNKELGWKKTGSF